MILPQQPTENFNNPVLSIHLALFSFSFKLPITVYILLLFLSYCLFPPTEKPMRTEVIVLVIHSSIHSNRYNATHIIDTQSIFVE